ncbi:hypothetical protein C0993_007990 [Termitomyces sp. T159_Od127]|nr:hypothetical protein C0993_007990 [Termitomyces sp. T159_Od127]
MQLNAANMQKALDPNQADPDSLTDPHNTLDYANNKEALCASRSRNWLWIDIPEETQEKRQCEGACILCSEEGHFINECPKRQVPHSSTSVNTLVDSGATDNFINKFLATLAATPWKLPLPICLTLFNGSSTSTSNITHYVQTTLTFANSQQQDLQLLVTHLHASAPLILGLP